MPCSYTKIGQEIKGINRPRIPNESISAKRPIRGCYYQKVDREQLQY